MLPDHFFIIEYHIQVGQQIHWTNIIRQQLNHHVFWLYHRSGFKNRYPIRETNWISLIFLTAQLPMFVLVVHLVGLMRSKHHCKYLHVIQLNAWSSITETRTRDFYNITTFALIPCRKPQLTAMLHLYWYKRWENTTPTSVPSRRKKTLILSKQSTHSIYLPEGT